MIDDHTERKTEDRPDRAANKPDLPAKNAKEARLGAALRENLRRRKEARRKDKD